MLAGELYSPKDPELRKMHLRSKKLFGKYNKTNPENEKKLNKLIKRIMGKTGDSVRVSPPFYCDYGCNITVGENFFANYNFIGLDGNYCRFGDNVWIAPNVSILAAGHPLDMQDRIDGWEYAFPVTVGNNVWIGGSVTIIGGVTIGDNAVIAAGSVVIRDVPADTLVAGNPARVIRKITADDRKKYQWAEQDKK